MAAMEPAPVSFRGAGSGAVPALTAEPVQIHCPCINGMAVFTAAVADPAAGKAAPGRDRNSAIVFNRIAQMHAGRMQRLWQQNPEQTSIHCQAAPLHHG